MTFLARMRADTGAPYPAWLYLLDKLAHTALGAWFLVTVLAEPLLYAAVLSALSYLLLGKLWWLRSQNEPVVKGIEARDWAFDGVLGLGIAVLALRPVVGWLVLGTVFVAWCLLLLAGSNNRWGRPS